jgi:hypothetical protein
MKHILNNLSDEEKNSILEQHTGGMKVMNENFSKLLNSKLGDAKPLVSEAMMNNSTVQMGGKRILSCFNPDKYPNTWKAAGGSAKVAFGLLLMNLAVGEEILTFGIGTIPAGLTAAAGVASTTVGIKKIYDANISRIDNELKSLYHCVFG